MFPSGTNFLGIPGMFPCTNNIVIDTSLNFLRGVLNAALNSARFKLAGQVCMALCLIFHFVLKGNLHRNIISTAITYYHHVFVPCHYPVCLTSKE